MKNEDNVLWNKGFATKPGARCAEICWGYGLRPFLIEKRKGLFSFTMTRIAGIPS